MAQITELQQLEILIKDLAFQNNREAKLSIRYHIEEKGFTAGCFFDGEAVVSDVMPTVASAAVSLWVELAAVKRAYLESYK